MEKVLLFGSGEFGVRVCRYLKNKGIIPIAFLDNNESKWGRTVEGVGVISPTDIRKYEYDKVAICVNDTIYEEIYSQLEKELQVEKGKIVHWTYWQREDFLEYYSSIDVNDQDKRRIIETVERSDRLRAFNYSFVEKYKDGIGCVLDESCGLYYANYNGKKLYLNRNFSSKGAAEKYIASLLIEQDEMSPHKYLDDGFSFDDGVLLDCGAAEGNFSLELAEKAEKIILVEADECWNEALEKTFEPWKEKVVIINKYLGNKDDDIFVTINSLAKEYDIDFIKMDIEGAEVEALSAARDYLKNRNKMKLAVCVYHNLEDERKIREILEPIGFVGETTKGYMVFPDNMNQPPRLVHGVLRMQKDE